MVESLKPFTHPPEAYKHIKAWGQMMGSFSGFIEGQQNLASRDGAPIDAVYQEMDWSKPGGKGDWRTYSEVKSESTRRIINEIMGSWHARRD